MKDGKRLYFSSAEFAIMLELAGEAPCSLLHGGSLPDDAALAKAFISLFQRGLIRREKDRLAVSGEGQLFLQIRNAPVAVVMPRTMPHGSELICYVEEDILLLVELADAILTRQYRLQVLGRPELVAWLFDAGLLNRPVLTDGDVPELAALFADELEENAGRPTFRLEKYRNGGELLETYELRRGKGGCLLYHAGETACGTEIYTTEALSRMLTDCFGKGSYDYC